MPGVNRDLLMLADARHLSAAALEREISFLNTVLFHVENWESFSTANELIDINRRKIIRKTHLIQKILSEKKVKAFVFTSNKN
jgi:hypothetical protein